MRGVTMGEPLTCCPEKEPGPLYYERRGGEDGKEMTRVMQVPVPPFLIFAGP